MREVKEKKKIVSILENKMKRRCCGNPSKITAEQEAKLLLT